MSARRVIVLAYYFPPLTGIASERAASLSAQLLDLGWDPLVITARSGFYHRTGERREEPFTVIRTPSLELSRALRKAYAIAAGAAEAADSFNVEAIVTGGVGTYARGLVRDFLYIPDAQLGWIPFATAAARRAVHDTAGSRVLFSSSVPYSAHLAAMGVARNSGVGWVAEFRDPWSTALWPNQSNRRIRRSINRALERRIVNTADHVVVTSESTRLELLETHADLTPERISVVTNGFVPMPERPRLGSGEPMTILYAGTVWAGEETAPVLAALDRVHSRNPGSFRLRILGPRQAWNRPLGGAVERPWLELGGIVSPQRAREAMSESTVLLLVQCHSAYRKVLPGKLFEYVGARRPILAMVPGDVEMATVLRSYADVRLVGPGALADFTSAVEQLLEEHRAGTLQAPRVPQEVTRPLRRREQAEKLAEIFDRVAGRKSSYASTSVCR